ncbi:heterokaryon incompatibility protein-domain-containing protein [Xylariaceae sp. FL1651]|nr:heterokaryon incompatibility protein-domain-containing protein [Xylariaceae sp. FL1651]
MAMQFTNARVLQGLMGRLAAPALRLGPVLTRRVRITVHIICDVILRILKSCFSLCLFLVFAVLWVTIRLIFRLGGRVIFPAIEGYVFVRAAIPRLLLRFITTLKEPYQYQPLSQATSEIRLLRVHSVTDAWGFKGLKLINVDIISVPVASAPPFAAVSYRWTCGNSLPILLGGKKFAASSSIYELLSALQSDANHSGEEQLLWIDSICINQTDLKEKSWQIGLMRDVYRSATHVIGWLGSDAPSISKWRGIDGVREAADIICNDFFFRTWIIQEISLAKKVVMYTRHDTCAWDEGVLGIARGQGPSFSLYGENEFGLSSRIMTRLGHGIKNMNGMETFRASLKENPDGLPLSELLVRSVEFQCTDPRDRIYGLLGLTTENARSNITVDYSDTNSELDVSSEVVRFSITGESSFQLIELSGVGVSCTKLQRQQLNERPSWIPDWEAPHIPRMKEILAHASSHKTATHLPCKVSPMANHAHLKSIHIEGAFVDEVKQLITTTWNLPGTCDFRDKASLAQLNEFLDHLDMVCETARGNQPHLYEIKDGDHAILRTVTKTGSLTKKETLDFDKLRLDLEQISRTLRSRLSGEIDRVRRDQIAEMDFRHFVMGLEEFMPLIVGRRLCVTEQGRFAIVPALAEVGDKICVFSGAPNPFVLRVRDEVAGKYQLVGVCCVDGIMEGELRRTNLELGMLCIV